LFFREKDVTDVSDEGEAAQPLDLLRMTASRVTLVNARSIEEDPVSSEYFAKIKPGFLLILNMKSFVLIF
jgi:hypothetical protein